MDIFTEVKSRVNNKELAQFYLGKPAKYIGQSIFYKSPFRNERTPSFSVSEKGFMDFGSGWKSDCIGFVAEYLKLKPLQAALKINEDFNLNISSSSRNYPGNNDAVNDRLIIKGLKVWRNKTFDSLTYAFKLCRMIKRSIGSTDSELLYNLSEIEAKGARFVSSIEVAEGKRLNESLVKQLTGQDIITARFLHKEFFEFKPQFSIWLVCNHKPQIRGTDHGIWRRIRLIPFEVTIPPEEQDKDLVEKLKAELPGILNWIVMGCLEWQKRGLSAPEEVIDATNDYRKEMDSIGMFLDECTVTGTVKVKVADLYRSYVQWAKDNGEYELSQAKFGIRLTERGLEKKRGTGGTWYWQGIGLKIDESEFEVHNPFK